MNDECAFCNGSGVELVDGLGVNCVWCDSVAAVIAEDAAAREPVNAPTVKAVPPAGDVEVPMRSNVQRYHAAEVIGSNRPGFWVHAGDYNADLSRLTAERDGLLAEVKRLDLKVSEYDYTFDSQQAELTKARELAIKASNSVRHHYSHIESQIGTTLHKELYRDKLRELAALVREIDGLAHQSAPAAKEHVEDGKASDA